MINNKEFNIIKLQFSIFTPFVSFATNKILASFISNFGKQLDGEPIMLPLPVDTPPDVPRLILKSKDKKLEVNISNTRLNCFTYLDKNMIPIDEKAFFQFCLSIVKEYVKCASAKIGRLAIVTIKYMPNDTAGLTLAQHFCKEKWIEQPFNRPENFELHSHKKYQLQDFFINSWVRCKTGNLTQTNQPIILVEQDINTLSEEVNDRDFNYEQIAKFIQVVPQEQNKILTIYFPG